jgi:hypothetical protein
LTHTDSAKRTRIGRVFSLCFFAGESSVDFRPFIVWVSLGWHTTISTLLSQLRTSWMTWSRGASFTSSPLTAKIWSPGSSCEMKRQNFRLKAPNGRSGGFYLSNAGTALGDEANYHRLFAAGHKAKAKRRRTMQHDLPRHRRRFVVAIPLGPLECCRFV